MGHEYKCELCACDAGKDYFSDERCNTFGGIGLVLCHPCAVKLGDMSDAQFKKALAEARKPKGKRIRVFAVVDVHPRFKLSEAHSLFATSREGGPVLQFAVARKGVTEFFEKLGYVDDKDVAAVKPTSHAAALGLFVHDKDRTLCPHCVPDTLDLGDEGVQTWEVGSHGWTSAPVCDECHASIPVFVDGKADEPTREEFASDLADLADDLGLPFGDS